LNQLFDLFILYIPRVIGALLIMIGGVVLAYVARRVVVWLFQRLGFDQLGDRGGVTTLLQRGNVQHGPSQLIGNIVFYGVLALAALTALGNLGLEFLSGALNQVFLFAPRVLTAILLLFLGTAAAGLLADLAAQMLASAGVTRGAGLPGFVRWSVIFITVLLAAAALGIEITILVVIGVILLSGIALAAALAIGLGLRELSQNIAASRYVAEGLAEGDRVTIDGVSGTIERIGHGLTTVRGADGVAYLIPNAHFMQHVVRKGAADR
jgi:small-conductance mechanosensitive channel